MTNFYKELFVNHAVASLSRRIGWQGHNIQYHLLSIKRSGFSFLAYSFIIFQIILMLFTFYENLSYLGEDLILAVCIIIQEVR